MKLDWTGSHVGNRTGKWSPFKIMVAIAMFHALFWITVISGASASPGDDNTPTWAASLLKLQAALLPALALYTLVAKIRTRAYIRQKYGIRPTICSGCCGCGSCCDDYCASSSLGCLSLGCLTTAQMDRHTANYDRYGADGFSSTGLSHYAPTVV
jgi:hypothetical protein